MKTSIIPRRIFLVDYHPIVCFAIRSVIEKDKSLRVCGSASNIHKALEAIRTLKPDLIVTELALWDSNGINLIVNVKVLFPDLPVLVFTEQNEIFYALRAISVGANGYVEKSQGTEVILSAIKTILSGSTYFNPVVTDRLRKIKKRNKRFTGSPLVDLSDRELEVFWLLGKGFSQKKIAKHVKVSINTIKCYVLRIRKKMVLPTYSELVHTAFRWRE